MIINKKDFVEYIESIRKVVDFNKKINDVASGIFPDFEWVPPTLEFELCNLLEDMFGDSTETVYWFCYEINFGADYSPGDNMLNGTEWPLRTPEELYDYLFEIYKIHKEENHE